MRPIPWILAAVALTVLGILSTYEGQTTLSAPPGAPSLFGGRKMPAASTEVTDLPGTGPEAGPAAVPIPTSIVVPEGLVLPVSSHGKRLKPKPGLFVVITEGVEGTKPVKVGPSLPPADGSPQYTEVAVADLAAWLVAKKAELASPVAAVAPAPGVDGTHAAPPAPAKPVELEICLVMPAITQWEELLKPLLSACVKVDIEGVHLGVLSREEAPDVSSYYFEFILIEGPARTVCLEANDEREVGGVIMLRGSGSKTFFKFGDGDDANRKRVAQHKDAIDARHTEAVEWENAQYSESGRAWALRMERGSGYGAVIEAANVLRDVGVQRFCFEE